MEQPTTGVRFCDNNEEFHGTALDHAEAVKSNVWYQADDMKKMKEEAFQLARQAGKYGVGNLLVDTYGKEDQASIDAIQAWAIACGGRRGLERFHCRQYAKKRMDIRRKTICSVLKAQYRMHVEEQLTDRDYTAMVIGRLAETFSQGSHRFAQVLGAADEAALQHQQPGPELGTASPVEKKPKLVQRQKSPHSVMAFDPFGIVSPSKSMRSPGVPSSSFSKTISRPSPSSAATTFLSHF